MPQDPFRCESLFVSLGPLVFGLGHSPQLLGFWLRIVLKYKIKGSRGFMKTRMADFFAWPISVIVLTEVMVVEA